MTSTWLIIFAVVVMILFLFVVIYIAASRNVKNTEGKMVAEIWESSGYPIRHLVPIDKNGKTVEVDGLVYALPREKNAEVTGEGNRKAGEGKQEGDDQHHYPSRRYVLYPAKPPFGLRPLQTTLRIESWEKDNPEPIRPFYGRVDENGKFVANQLTVTSSEWSAQKREIQATVLAMEIQENEARQKELTKALANQPSKMILYIGLGISSLGVLINLFFIWQIAQALGG